METGNPHYRKVDIHWNLEGSRLTATLVTQILQKHSILPPDPSN
jgi:hypothetical protein